VGAEPPFAGRSEALWRATVAYREFAFIQYNASPARPGRGSAIFLHDDLGHPTNGCLSLPEQLIAPCGGCDLRRRSRISA
jgi:L,D-peptidoglycan transpeptidase YkuD (ErfK/YbiS/YcfS/YnhG family)